MPSSPTQARLPPDVVEASWTWSLDYERYRQPGQWQTTLVLRSPHPLLTCRVKLVNSVYFVDAVVTAEHSDGHQTASLSFEQRRPYVPACNYHDLATLQTSLGVIPFRVMYYTSLFVRAWAEPSSVVAFVKALEMYAKDEVYF